MVIDSSALLSIVFEEDDQALYARAIDSDSNRFMSTASFVESSIAIEKRRGADGVIKLNQLISRSSIELVPVDAVQAHTSRSAYRVFGKGRHQAALDIGDCFACALAITLMEPLLYKCNDFSRTDVAQVPV